MEGKAEIWGKGWLERLLGGPGRKTARVLPNAWLTLGAAGYTCGRNASDAPVRPASGLPLLRAWTSAPPNTECKSRDESHSSVPNAHPNVGGRSARAE